MDRVDVMLCPVCGQPLQPNTFAVPIVTIDDNGMPETGELGFAHHQCPAGAPLTWALEDLTKWRLP